jgi:hypothetical protein
LINVDALVNDPVADEQGRSTPLTSQILDPPRRATPTIPPGFTAPAVSKFLASEQPVRPLSRNATTTIAPAVPVVPITPGQVSTPVKSKRAKQATEADDAPSPHVKDTSTTVTSAPATPSKSSRKTSSAKMPAVPETPKKAVEEPPAVATKEDRKPIASIAKTTPKKAAIVKKSPATIDSSPRKHTKDTSAVTVDPASYKRQHPGKLDITAAISVPNHEQSSVASSVKHEAQAKVIHAVSTATNNSVPTSPAPTSTDSPVKKPTARTLRVVATPKAENPPPLSAVSAISHPQIPTVEKLRSRQASIASVNMPGTPVSDLVSDTASITSTSFSRANSPPLIGGKVGTAPVRKKTKSQQKKDRQERARKEEERAMAMEEPKSEPEVVQEALMGRKKKAKKPVSNPKPLSVLTKSQPQSPKPTEIEDVKEQPTTPEVTPITTKKGHLAKVSVSSPHPEPTTPAADTTGGDKREVNAQSIIADLQKTGELIASTLEFFKPLSSSLAQASRTAQTSGGPITPPDLKMHLSPADVEALSKKRPVRLNGPDGKPDSSTLITPQGKFFWGLTHELEEKALELEKHIEELKGARRFHAQKGASQRQRAASQVLPTISTALKEAGASLSKSVGQSMPKLDPTSTLLGQTSLPLPPVQAQIDPPPPQAPVQQQQAPADAGTYLNQFVLPKTENPGSNSSRTEMAAVGGLPGAGTANMSVSVSKIAKAARAVAEGGAVGTELEGMGVMAADLLGGVFVQGLEALVGAGLNFSSSTQNIALDSNGNLSLGGTGIDVQGLVNAFDANGALGGYASRGAGGHGRSRRPPGMEEAEQAMLAAKKEHEAIEKKLAGIMKRNKKMVGGTCKV